MAPTRLGAFVSHRPSRRRPSTTDPPIVYGRGGQSIQNPIIGGFNLGHGCVSVGYIDSHTRGWSAYSLWWSVEFFDFVCQYFVFRLIDPGSIVDVQTCISVPFGG